RTTITPRIFASVRRNGRSGSRPSKRSVVAARTARFQSTSWRRCDGSLVSRWAGSPKTIASLHGAASVGALAFQICSVVIATTPTYPDRRGGKRANPYGVGVAVGSGVIVGTTVEVGDGLGVELKDGETDGVADGVTVDTGVTVADGDVDTAGGATTGA